MRITTDWKLLIIQHDQVPHSVIQIGHLDTLFSNLFSQPPLPLEAV